MGCSKAFSCNGYKKLQEKLMTENVDFLDMQKDREVLLGKKIMQFSSIFSLFSLNLWYS